MLLNVLIDNHLIQFLLPADLLRFARGKSDCTQVFEEKFTFFKLLTVTLVETSVTFGTHFSCNQNVPGYRQQPSKHGQKNPYH